jgi:RHS repeat-associated protein
MQNTNTLVFCITTPSMDRKIRLYHYKARIHDPLGGRFLQTYPIGSDDDINLYAYVRGDPINGTDPTGLCFDNCPVNITRNAKNASGTFGITGTISYENGLLGNTSAGQVS